MVVSVSFLHRGQAVFLIILRDGSFEDQVQGKWRRCSGRRESARSALSNSSTLYVRAQQINILPLSCYDRLLNACSSSNYVVTSLLGKVIQGKQAYGTD